MEGCVLFLVLGFFSLNGANTQITSRGSDAQQSYTVSDMEKFISLEPSSVHPVFGEMRTDITHLEEDQMIQGNILAIQDHSIVTYYPNGTIQYIASSLEDEQFMNNYQGSKDKVLILEKPPNYGGLVQTKKNLDSHIYETKRNTDYYIYVTLKYQHCIKSIDRLRITLLHISGTCGHMTLKRFKERPALTDVPNAMYYGPGGMAVYEQNDGQTVTSFYVTEAFSALITLVNLQSNIVTGFKPHIDGTLPGPHAIALTNNNTVLVAAGTGVYEADSHGYFQWIIALRRTQTVPDGSFGRAWGFGAHSIKRIPGTDTYIFAEPSYWGIRIIDTKARQVQTLCYNSNKISTAQNDSRPTCNLQLPSSVLVMTNNTVLVVGMNNAVVKFQLSSSSNDSSLKLSRKDVVPLKGFKQRNTCITDDSGEDISGHLLRNEASGSRTASVLQMVLLSIAIMRNEI